MAQKLKVFVLLLAAAGFFIFTAQVQAQIQIDENRPLRSVQPKPLPAVRSAPSAALAHNSLISPAALEHPLTQRYIAQYSSTSGIAYFNSVMERAAVYLPFIREEVARRGLPPELAYLPVIESGFQITARSRSGAVGLWQFMLNSISPFDIKVNDYIDERRDFIKSTKGALHKLEDNYMTLGSWELALAAYNAGLGSVLRTVQRTKINDYWELAKRKEFKQETEHYVPKLIAAAYVLSQPRRFGVNIWNESFAWTAIPLPRQVSLDILAEEAGLDKDILRKLNAQLLQGISPADNNFHLLVPTAKLAEINQVLEREDLKLIRYYHHVVRQGDTLWSMSRHYGIPLNLIEQHNSGIANRYLKIGETIIIPAYGDIAPPPSISRSAVTAVFDGSHVVGRGDTLWSLGRRYGVDPQVLAEANGMALDAILREGRTLKVPIIE